MRRVRQVRSLLLLLQKLNLITRFHAENQNFYKAYPAYSLLVKPVKIYYRKSNPITITHKALRLLNQSTGNSNLVLETSKGLMTHQEALQKQLGGILVCVIF